MNKKYRRIGEIANELGIKESAIRFWQTKIPQLNPKKNRSGHRIFTDKDFEIVKLIHNYKKSGLTLEGIIKKLEDVVPSNVSKDFSEKMNSLIDNLRKLIEDL